MKNLFIRNVSWQIIGKVFQMLLGFFVTIIITRYLGPKNFGSISYVMSYVTFFSTIANLGINNILVKELVQNKNQDDVILGSSLVLRFISTVISTFFLIIIIYLISNGNKELLIICCFQCIGLFFQQFEVFIYWYRANLNSKAIMIISSCAYIILNIYKVLIVYFSASIYYFAFMSSLEQILLGIMFYLSYKKISKQNISFDFAVARNLLKKSNHYIYSSVMGATYNQMDKIMLGSLMTVEDVGFYSIAIGVNSMWVFIINSIIIVAEPIIMNEFKNNKDKFIMLLKKLYCVIFYLSLFIAIVIALFSDQIILILYGKDFITVGNILFFSSFIVGLAFLGVARGIWIVCYNMQKYLKYFSFIGMFANIILNFILIKQYGIVGAVFATIATQLIVVFICPYLFKDTRICAKIIFDAIIFKFK